MSFIQQSDKRLEDYKIALQMQCLIEFNSDIGEVTMMEKHSGARVEKNTYWRVPVIVFSQVLKDISEKNDEPVYIVLHKICNYVPGPNVEQRLYRFALVSDDDGIQGPTIDEQYMEEVLKKNAGPIADTPLAKVDDPRVNKARAKYEKAREEYEQSLKEYYQSIYA